MMIKVKHEGKTYTLRGGDAWSAARFDYIKKEAREFAKVCVLDDKGDMYLVPLKNLERVEDV
jgi:hypothetical protein